MTAERLTVRERFVEAMRQFKTIHEDWFGHEDLSAAFRQAIEAFADAECAMRCEGFNAGLESVSATEGYYTGPYMHRTHDNCRAALLKEVFGE